MSAILRKFDWPLVLIAVSLVSFGLLTLYGIGPLARDFFYRQILFLVIGLGAVFLFAKIDYRIFKNFSIVAILFYAVIILFLFAVLQVSPIRSVRSWITLHTFQFEPSEVAKLALLLLLAKYFSRKHVEIYSIRHIVASFFYTAVPAFLVFIQPDLGSAVIFFIIWFALLFASGVKKEHVVGILIIGVLFASFAWVGILEDYQKNRISSFLNPFSDPRGEGYSVIQSRIAIGSGLWLGAGLGKGTQSSGGFLPEAHTDFIFASLAEQFGFVGVAALVFLILMLVLRVSQICRRAKDNFSKLFGIGFISIFLFHTILNIGINIGFLPVTGLPFSFVSYGGSHLLTLMIGIGIIESIKIHGIYG